jgi:hypothetical protein
MSFNSDIKQLSILCAYDFLLLFAEMAKTFQAKMSVSF